MHGKCMAYTQSLLELETRPRFHTVSSSLSMAAVIGAAVASLMPAVVPASVAAVIVTAAVSCSVTLQRDEKAWQRKTL